MSEDETSPGPWRWEKREGVDEEGQYEALLDARGMIVVSASCTNDAEYAWVYAERPADARLIQHAPDMLALLRRLRTVRGVPELNGLIDDAARLVDRIDGGGKT
jgi:hypothetical protein